MKKIHILFIASILIGFVKLSFGQSLPAQGTMMQLTEKVGMITDRTVFCVGETLHFKAYNLSNEDLKKADWSTVLYVELISSDGKPFIQQKYAFTSYGSRGELNLPSDLLTGIYYLRAYTKWMRNYSPYEFCYQVIKVINPFNAEVLQAANESSQAMLHNFSDTLENQDIQVRSNKQQFHKREAIDLSVKSMPDVDPRQNFTLSVIKRGGIEFTTQPIVDSIKNTVTTLPFIPETRGVTLTGRAVNKGDSMPIPNLQLNLTVFNKPNEYLGAITDRDGKFFFSLPDHYGQMELFISAKILKSELEPVILVDNDFCTSEVNLPFIPFTLSENEKMLYNEMSINSQVTNKYKDLKDTIQQIDTLSNPPFYGEPTFTLKFSDYIPLPTMEDYITELLPMVSVHKKDKVKYLKIRGLYSELTIYDPLVLVDFVAVSNIDRVLSISPRKVKRIEVIAKPYVKGAIVYGGIVHIISKDGDFAGVSLPSSGQFFKISAFEPIENQKTGEVLNNRTPDTRNSLYWNPSIKFVNGQQINFEFSAGDTSGEYIALIRGFDKSGKQITGYCSFWVND